jgi:hypothetical protein
LSITTFSRHPNGLWKDRVLNYWLSIFSKYGDPNSPFSPFLKMQFLNNIIKKYNDFENIW